jgi:hypothetical protein
LSSKRSGDDLIPGRELVLVARTGATWSALVAVDESGAVDLAQQPRAAAGVAVSMYEELPYRGGTLHWVQTASEFSETATGETEERGHSALTLCWVRGDREAAPPTCARFLLAEWDYTFEMMDDDDGAEQCQVRKAVSYHVDAASDGQLHVVLEVGVDDGVAGRYRL